MMKTKKMYHGTTSAFAESILKNGLIPNPENRVFSSYSNKSPGVHLTSSIKEAFNPYAINAPLHGGYPMIIELQVDPTTGNRDETDNDPIINLWFSEVIGFHGVNRIISMTAFDGHNGDISSLYGTPSKKLVKFVNHRKDDWPTNTETEFAILMGDDNE